MRIPRALAVKQLAHGYRTMLGSHIFRFTLAAAEYSCSGVLTPALLASLSGLPVIMQVP
jgi:hypothetical protein